MILLASWMAASCAPDQDVGELWIMGNQLVGKKTQCAAKASGGSTELISRGIMDLMTTNRYVLFPMVKNGLEQLDKTLGLGFEEGYPETHTVIIKGAWVSFQLEGLEGAYDGTDQPTDLADLGEIWIPTSGAVEPAVTNPVVLEAVPPLVGQLLDKDIAFDGYSSGGVMTIHVVIEGVQFDGTVMHSVPFDFPILVCRGCLVLHDSYPELCCITNVTSMFLPCYPGQDEPTSCAQACRLLYGTDRWAAKRAMIMQKRATLAEYPGWNTPEWGPEPTVPGFESPPENP